MNLTLHELFTGSIITNIVYYLNITTVVVNLYKH